jgi:hypothetical protein
MNRQKELEKVLAKEQFILDSFESRIIDRLKAVETMKVQVVSQKETVEKARSNLNLWVNAPTMTKAQVVREADRIRVVIQDSSDQEEYFVHLCAPKGFAMDDSDEPTKCVREFPENMTKGMFWSLVCESLGTKEQEYDPEYGYEYDETGRMVG